MPIDPTDALARWPGSKIAARYGGNQQVVSAVDQYALKAQAREIVSASTHVVSDDDTGLLLTDGAAQTIAQYEFSLSAGRVRVAGHVAEIAALNDQPMVGTDAWAKTLKLDGTSGATAVLSADGKTYDAALIVILIDNAGARSVDLRLILGNEADDGEEVAPTSQQIRDCLAAAAITNNDPNAFLVVGRVKIQRVATDTITTTITDPAVTDALRQERSWGYCLDAS